MSTANDLRLGAAERFSDVLRTATSADHEAAAGAAVMSSLFDGSLPRRAYAAMVGQHWFAYRVLEAAADRLADDPLAGPFVDEALRRQPSLEVDLEVLLGADWREDLSATPATRCYCDRMEQVCRAEPARFVAHHYTRYMGDLSGGQVIGRIARGVYRLSPDAGAAFYEFPLIEDLAAFKEGYRRRLDAAALDDAQRADLLEEVSIAYRLNTEVFADLDGMLDAGGSA